VCLLIVVVPYVDRCVTRSKDEGGRAGRQIAPLVSLELGTLDGGLEPPASRGLFEFSKSKLGHVLRARVILIAQSGKPQPKGTLFHNCSALPRKVHCVYTLLWRG
jgi:hypothetical protein